MRDRSDIGNRYGQRRTSDTNILTGENGWRRRKRKCGQSDRRNQWMRISQRCVKQRPDICAGALVEQALPTTAAGVPASLVGGPICDAGCAGGWARRQRSRSHAAVRCRGTSETAIERNGRSIVQSPLEVICVLDKVGGVGAKDC